jgi:hypothetical protein
VSASSALNATTTKTVTANCSSGKKALGGGFFVTVTDGSDSQSNLDNVAEVTHIESRGNTAPPTLPTGWTVQAVVDSNNDMDDNWQVTAYAICATIN